MTGRRTITIIVSTVLTAALATNSLAADPEVAANKERVVKCDGKVATKVGTARADVIRGTARRDIIAGLGGSDIIIGRGGNDVICGGAGNDRIAGGAGHDKLLGQTGRDRLFGQAGVDRLFGGQQNDVLAGQAGPDILFGGAGSDKLDGGVGVDACYQNTGHGPLVRCELPTAVYSPPAPRTLAIAYADLVRDHQYGEGDVLIAKLVDTDGNGVDAGDQIIMGKFPLHFSPGPEDFGEWGRKTHTVVSDDTVPQPARTVTVTSDLGYEHTWHQSETRYEGYTESGVLFAEITDAGPPGDGTDDLFVKESASDPDPAYRIEMSLAQRPAIDDFFIDVEFLD